MHYLSIISIFLKKKKNPMEKVRERGVIMTAIIAKKLPCREGEEKRG